MFTYSLAWNTAFNAVPNEYAIFSHMQYCKKAKKCYKLLKGQDWTISKSNARSVEAGQLFFLCSLIKSSMLKYRGHVKALMYG